MRRFGGAALALLMVLALLPACELPPDPVEVSPPVTALSISVPATSVLAGDWLQLAVSASTAEGKTLPTAGPVSWSVDNEEVATISATGVLTGRSGGWVRVTASLGTVSQSVSLRVMNPAPYIMAIDPVSAPAGQPGLTLAVRGRGFTRSSVVMWNGQPRTTDYLDGTELRVHLPASDLASGRRVSISVQSPGPGGGNSDGMLFVVTTAP